MSLLSRFFGSGARAAGPRQVCIIDASGFIEKRYREANGCPSPRDNFFVLKNLAHFAQREEIEAIAVFIGRPLREAGNGDSFKGVRVYYAEDDKTLAGKILELARSGRAKNNALIITDDRQLEKEAANAACQCLRLATFKKGMEGAFDHERAPRQSHQPQRRPPAETEPPPREEEKPPAGEGKSDKNVLDLIDPI